MNKEQTTAEEMIRKGIEEATGGQTWMRIIGLFKFAQVRGAF